MRTTTTIAFLLPLALFAAAPVLAAEAVAVPQFRSIELRGGGHVVVRPGPAQRVTILEGSRQFTGVRVNREGELELDACASRCPESYDLRVEIVTPAAPDAAVSGGGVIRFQPGFAPEAHLAVAVSGGGQIDARAVRVSNVSAAVNGGGRVLTGESANLSAAVNGGGEVRYAGNPHISSAVRGGGAVVRDR